MELSKIEKLLEKYLDANTSIQEEEALSNYFTSGKVAPHLQEYESMFGYFKMSKAETSMKPIQLKTKKPNWKRLSIAASIALICSLYFGNGYLEQQKAKEQYAQVKGALELLSSKLSKGNEAMSSSLYAYDDTVNKVFNTNK